MTWDGNFPMNRALLSRHLGSISKAFHPWARALPSFSAGAFNAESKRRVVSKGSDDNQSSPQNRKS
jgi:hypothetical protein